MAEEPYGTLFPENIGPLFTGQLPGQNPVLNKLGNLYQDTAQVQTPPLSTPVSAAPAVDTDEDIFKQFKPETRAQDEYFNLIKNLPARPEPTRGTRILAGLSTLGQGGLKQAENVKYSGYNRQVEDFKLKADMLKELAGSERSANVNDRMILNQLLQERRFDRRQTEVERKNKETAEQAQKRLDLQKFKQANPDSKFIRLGNGNWGVADPQTNQITDSGVKYGLSPLEDIMMERESTQQRQATQAEFDRRSEEQRQLHRIEIEKLQQQLKEALDRNKPLTPEQEKVGQYLRAQEVFNSDPMNKKFLKLGEPGTNTFKINIPTSMPEWTGYGEEDRKKNAQRYIDINKAIYGPAWNPPQNIKNIAESGYEAGRARQNVAPTTAAPATTRRRRYDKVADKTEESTDGGKTWKVIGKGRIP